MVPTRAPLWLLPLLLAGCAAPAPLTLERQAITPAQWQADAAQPDMATGYQPGWLEALHDPRLTELVAEALQQNPELAAAGSRLNSPGWPCASAPPIAGRR